jgi:hypothetical protein
MSENVNLKNKYIIKEIILKLLILLLLNWVFKQFKNKLINNQL